MSTTEKVHRIPPEIAADVAIEDYLTFGEHRPNMEQLESVLEGMHRGTKTSPRRRLFLAGMHFDAARLPETPTDVIAGHLDSAEQVLAEVADLDLESSGLRQYEYVLRAKLEQAYMPKYRASLLEGRDPSQADEARFMEKVLQIAGLSFAPAAIEPTNGEIITSTKAVRGVQFELGVHWLMARARRYGVASYNFWPSLPRENSPHSHEFGTGYGYDALVSEGPMFGEATPVQLKSVLGNREYDDEILVIAGREHLGLKSGDEILRLAVQEAWPTDEIEADMAAERLEEIENQLLDRIEGEDQ